LYSMIDPLLARTTKRLPSCEKDTLPRVILDTSTPALATPARSAEKANMVAATETRIHDVLAERFEEYVIVFFILISSYVCET